MHFSTGQEKVHNRKKHRKLSPVSMGFANFWRDRKKSVSIAVSLSLGGILLLVVSSLVLTRSPEQAARLLFPDGDYKIYLSSEQPEEEIMAAGNPLDENLRQEILSVDGVVDVLVTRRSLHAKFRTSESAEAGMCDILTDSNRMDVEAALVSGAMPADTHSVLLSTGYQKHHADMDVGATMELILGQETVTVTISGLFDASKTANGHGSLSLDSAALFAPEGMCHALFAALTVLILGLPISVAVCAKVSKKSFAGVVVPYQFPFLQMGLFLLVLFGMEVVLSVWMVRRQKKQSLVEQMRAQS